MKADREKEFEVLFRKDENAWMASFKDAKHQQERTAGYGETPEEAFHDLFYEKSKADYQNEVNKESKS